MQKLALFLFIVLLGQLWVIEASGNAGEGVPLGYIRDYKEIPGVSAEDIQAVEALKSKYKKFVYGTLHGDEAFKSIDGSSGGFAIKFCAMLTDMFGITFEHRIYYDWDLLFKSLSDKRLDFSGELTSSPERRKKFFMTDSICERTIKMFRNRDSSSMRRIAERRPLRYAFLEGTTTYEQVKKVSDLPIEPVYIDDYDTAAEMLRKQEIDAFFEESSAVINFENYDFIEIEDYFPLIYSPISMSTANPEFEPIIRVVQKYLEHGGIYYLVKLYSEGIRDYTRHKFQSSLSSEESAYLNKLKAGKQIINFVAESENYPVSFYNESEKEFQGIALDILKEISSLTGLEFVPVNNPGDPKSKLIEILQSRKASMIAGLTNISSKKYNLLWADQPFSSDQYALISSAEHPEIEINHILYSKVGLVKGNICANVYNEWFPNNTNSIYYKNWTEAFDALEDGKIDFVMSSQNGLLNRTNYQEQPGFKEGIVFDHSMHFSFAFNKDEPILRAVISKAQSLVSSKTINNRWERKVFDYRSKMMREIIPYLSAFSGALILLLLSLFWLHLKNKRLGKNLENLVKERTHELEVQTTTLETLFSSIPDLIFSKDLDNRFMQCNNSMAHYLNLEKEDIIGKTSEAVFGENIDDQLRQETDREVVDSRCIKVIEENIYSPYYDVSRFFETIKVPLVQGGDVIGIMGIARDITERKAIEKAAHEASQAKSDFLARMSHEIRTPLNAIIGMTQVAINSLTNPEKVLYSLEEIKTASSHLLELLNNVLDMSKIESGKFEIAKEPFSLLASLSEVSSIISQRSKEKQVFFKTNTRKLPDISLVGDKLRLNQVLINLLGNAVKFTDVNGVVSFHLNIIGETDEEIKIRFLLSDSGIGMTAEQTKRLFVAFEQTDSSISSRFGGTGLGLAISQNLVKLMGGEITVKSSPGIGSTFSFELLFPKADKIRLDRPAGHFAELDLTGIRILLAEDIYINRVIVQELLMETNVIIDEAEDGQQALDAFCNSPQGFYDLIFMDIQMPVMDGYETTQKIRLLPREDSKAIPIIAMTANAYQEDVNKALAVGMNGHLSKPIDLNVMLQTLAKIFNPNKTIQEMIQE